MLCSTSWSKWFHFRPDQVQSPELQTCWPWQNVSLDEWIWIAKKVVAVTPLEAAVQLSVLLISPIGIFGSFCSAAAVWRKATKEKERFYIWMLAIALQDLLFNILYIPLVLSFNNLFPNVYQFSYSGTELANGMPAGLLWGLSLSADLCTLALTFERYLILCKPVCFENVNKKIITILSIAVVLIGGAARFVVSGTSYTAAAVGVDNQTSFTLYSGVTTSWYKSDWFSGLMFFSDTLLPFMLLFSMTSFSIRIAAVVIKRSKSRVHDSAPREQQQQIHEQSAAILKLLFVLMASFLLCQLGYCLHAISIIVKKARVGSFSSGFHELVLYANALLYWDASWLLRTIFECMARSLNFYFYYCLSNSIREEFRKALRWKVRADCSHKRTAVSQLSTWM